MKYWLSLSAIVYAALAIDVTFDSDPALRIKNNTSCVYHEAVNKANCTGIVYLGDFDTLSKCTGAVLAFQNATSFTWFEPNFMKSNKWSSGCYARTDKKYPEIKKKLVISGIVANQPTPPVPNKSSCKSDIDCSLNGVCSLKTPRTCVCDRAWKGSTCAQFNFVPGVRNSGYRNINIGGPYNNFSSWGGGGWYDYDAKKWYMWASELADHCGMHTWTTNSQTIRASSNTSTGLYVREGVQVGIWSHESAVTRTPDGKTYVAYFSYNAHEGPSRPVCKLCTDGSTNPKCKKMASNVGKVRIENTDPTFMAHSLNGATEWSKPVLVQKGEVQMDSNMAGVIATNGSFLGMWRDHHPGGKHSTPHLVTASNWSDPDTYVFHHEDLLFGQGTNPGGLEDMFLWTDARGHYHAVFHVMFGCDTCTGHAFSADGLSWTYTGVAANGQARYSDGSEEVFGHCERPKIIFDESGVKPVALTNGVKIQGLSNDDQSFTLLRPLQV